MAEDRQHGLSRRAHWAGGDKLISRLMAEALARPDLVSLAAGFVDQVTLPVEATQQALDALWSHPLRARAALQYGTTIGHVPLREAIIDRMTAADGSAGLRPVPPLEQVVVTAGSNQLLHLVADTLLDPGDIVLCAAPSYFVFMATLANVGARTVGVEIDADGMIPEALEQEFARRKAAGELARVKAIYVVTYYDNPAGTTTTGVRRQQLIEIAVRWSHEGTIYLIEDAAYRELRYYGDDVPSLYSLDADGDRVIHAGTFSKPFSPGIRVGWGILPRKLVEPVLAQKGNVDFGSPCFNQVLMSTVMEMGLYDRHVASVRESYRGKLDATLAAVQAALKPLGVEWVRPTGGLYVWLWLPESIDTGVDGPLFPRAIAEGVLYVPGECCYPQEGCPRRRNMLRLSFGVPSIAEIRHGVKSLALALEPLTI
ncbi:MAG: PLP-dependent aminotransferase family protein [Thermoguttaceae bacterium]|jgi:2-aminoadipate transaminase